MHHIGSGLQVHILNASPLRHRQRAADAVAEMLAGVVLAMIFVFVLL